MEQGIPKNLYREHILELYKSPENYGILKKPTFKATGYNSICGDEITFYLQIKNKKIKDIKFSGSGCVISIVSASMLTDKLKNMHVNEAKKLSKEDILNSLKIKLSPSRIKCALLPLETLRKALK